MSRPWFEVEGVENLESPALLVHRERVESNIDRMLEIARGNTARLRPHVKTHKMAELVRWQLQRGLTQFKCATIAEAEMLGQVGVAHVLLAYPITGPNIRRFVELASRFPNTTFACLVDNHASVVALAAESTRNGQTTEALVDLDCGMHRTGVPPDDSAFALYHLISTTPGLTPGGLHAYDGHIHQPDPAERASSCLEAFAPVWKLAEAIRAANLPLPRIVAGGTPTYPIHIRDPRVECSPGTPLLWDFGYAEKFADLPFLTAAVLITRVISRPSPGLVCTDLGYKAVASESPQPRVKFLNLPDAEPVMHSEEHLVLKVPVGSEPSVGSVLYAIPRHICPTVALYDEAVLIESGKPAGSLKITARGRHLSI